VKHFFLALVLFLLPAFGFAQSTSATISGGVTDPAGGFIVDADVRIANDATGVLYSARTNNSGMYLVPILPPGHYHVQVSKPGFKTIIKADVLLNVQSAVALNFVLPIGATSESVTVEAASSVINTTDASVSTVIDRKFVENIPLNGRSFQDLIQMTPGVVTQSPQTSAYVGGQGDFSVNGQRTESNYYTVDGVSAAGAGEATGYAQNANSGSIAASTALGTTQSILSVDALQEFRVSSSTYSAEYGGGPGGQFSFSTRSGTNGFHGTVFDYLRNDAVDANDWFNNQYSEPKTALRQNDFGGTFGGPIRLPHLYNGVGKSFFFVSYEGLRLVEPTPASIQYVPSLAVRSSSPTVLQGIFNAFPLPTGPETAVPCDGVTFDCPSDQPVGTPVPTGLSPFVKGYSQPAQIDATSMRLDQKVSEKLSAFLRVAYTPTSSQLRNLSQISNSELGTISYTAGATSPWSSALSNEFRFGYVRSRSALVSSLDAFGGAVPINLRSAMGIPGTYASSAPTPYISISGIGTSALSWNDALTKFHQWNITDTLSWLEGHHALSFGIDERHISSSLAPPDLVALAEFLSRQSMTANSVDFNFLQKNDPSVPTFNEFAAFAQDEWKVSPSLSLSLGLRWEVNPPPQGASGRDAYTVLGNVNAPETLALAPRGTPLWKTSWYNFAPRLGAAWTVHSHHDLETVLRAGGGVYFDTGNQLGTQGFSQLGFYAYQVYLNTPLLISSTQLDFSTLPTPPYTQSGVYAFPPHMQLPYALQWNTSLEQTLGKSQSVSISYVASAGRRLLQTQQRNVASLNPEFGNINYVVSGATSNYQSMQVKFQRSIPHGLHSLVSYAWSHSLDYGSNNAALPLTYGNSDFDVRHNLQGGVSWDLPKYRGNPTVSTLLNDWSTDQRVMLRTAFPITLQGNLVTDPVTGNNYYGNLNLIPGAPLYLYGSQYPGGKAINPGAFGYPSDPNSKGNAPRNFVRGFGEAQWNAALRREFRIHEDLTAQFRVEAFNILNHPNFGYVDPTRSDAQFGLATSMLNQSLGSMSALYQQGGPRSMQFALKLTF
jgi:hypothetical protein